MSLVDASAEWQAFYVALVGGSAALTGLLFVALTHHPEQIFSEVTAHRRAVTVQLALLWVFFTSLLMLVPSRYGRLPGLLVLLVAVAWLAYLLYGQLRRRHRVYLAHAIPSDMAAVVVGANATALSLGEPTSVLYLAQAIALLVMVSVAAHRAWLLVVPAEPVTQRQV